MKPPYRKQLTRLVAGLCRIAEAHECSARIGAGRLGPRQRWAVLAAAGIYGDIARQVERRGARAWDHRVTVSDARKAGWVARAGWQALRPVPRNCHKAAEARVWTRRELACLA